MRPVQAASRLAFAAMVLASPLATAESGARLTVEGTEFVLTLPDGHTLRGADLRGAVITIPTADHAREIAIRDVEDDRNAIGGRVLLYRLEVKDPNGRWADLCAPDPDGRRLGFPVPDGQGGFELTCTSGAIGKCVRWGYRPWEQREGGPPLRDLHRACVHMTRADYGGDGSPATRQGVSVFFCDRFGIHPCERRSTMPFEAAWGVEGATCVARPRIPGLVSLEQLARDHPRLQNRMGGDACTEDRARRDPATLLLNRSAGK